ncbi:achaete-scute homolog 3 [Carettochelys insculpta]|uniref:achaete-scute homolog 3 n=1 Tax=Carettochelys insculpta TaxID=44489 RepID=UPI003EBF8D09
MDSKSFCNFMDKWPIYDSQHVQLTRPFVVDPFVTFHVYPEAPTQFTCSEDLPVLPFTSEQLIPENFYTDPCNFPYQVAQANYGRGDYSYGPAFIRKRNERERQRVKCVNEGYAKLRRHLPEEYLEKRLSKVETLRAAIKYIHHLQSVLYHDSALTEKNSLELGHTSNAIAREIQF